MNKNHSSSLSVLEETLQKGNIAISHVGSINVAELQDGDHPAIAAGKYSCINISVFVPISD